MSMVSEILVNEAVINVRLVKDQHREVASRLRQ